MGYRDSGYRIEEMDEIGDDFSQLRRGQVYFLPLLLEESRPDPFFT
jgi:hypothetical protein